MEPRWCSDPSPCLVLHCKQRLRRCQVSGQCLDDKKELEPKLMRESNVLCFANLRRTGTRFRVSHVGRRTSRASFIVFILKSPDWRGVACSEGSTRSASLDLGLNRDYVKLKGRPANQLGPTDFDSVLLSILLPNVVFTESNKAADCIQQQFHVRNNSFESAVLTHRVIFGPDQS